VHVITELSHIQILNWQSSIEAAQRALDRENPSACALRGRLTEVMSQFESCLASAQRLANLVVDLRRTVSAEHGRWTALIEQLPTPYVLTTRGGAIIAVNRAGARALNVSARALVGRSLLLFLDDRESWLQVLAHAASRPEGTTRSGKVRPRERQAVPVTVRLSSSETGEGSGFQWFWTEQRAEVRRRRDQVKPPRRSAQDGLGQTSAGSVRIDSADGASSGG
jgi:PAS domain S-box-containing protein